MIGWQISRYIIDRPLLHDIVGGFFLSLLVMYILGNVYIIYLLCKGSSKEKTPEWSYEGKSWSYWKTTK